jgi:mRNA interferase HigB
VYGDKDEMHVISKRPLREFWARIQESEQPLKEWWSNVSKAVWTNPADVKSTYNTVDIYRSCTVFDIGGNKFRLIAKVEFALRIVFVKHVLTHKEYDKGNWKNDCTPKLG